MTRRVGTALVPGLLAAALPAAAQEPVDVPYTKYVLDNGLRLIVHDSSPGSDACSTRRRRWPTPSASPGT